jgi:uncharacterized protein (DUF983 family)
MNVKLERGDGPPAELAEARPRLLAMWRGFLRRCPACGQGRLFQGYLKVSPRCDHCGEDLQHQRADDAPAYFTITIVGHVVIPLVIVAELGWQLPYWLHGVLWLPLTLGLTFWLMPRVKGAIVGLQWALRMHGFGSDGEPEAHYLERAPEP